MVMATFYHKMAMKPYHCMAYNMAYFYGSNGLELRRAVATFRPVEFLRKPALFHASISGEWLAADASFGWSGICASCQAATTHMTLPLTL